MLTVPGDCVVRYFNEDCLGGVKLLENEDIEIVWRVTTVVDVDIADLVYRRPRFEITEREKVVMAAYRELTSREFTLLGFSIVNDNRITWSGVHPDGHDVCDVWPYPVDTPDV